MGIFYRNLVNLRESNTYRLADCMNVAGNNMEKTVYCIRGYISGLDEDNQKLKIIVEEKCSQYL